MQGISYGIYLLTNNNLKLTIEKTKPAILYKEG